MQWLGVEIAAGAERTDAFFVVFPRANGDLPYHSLVDEGQWQHWWFTRGRWFVYSLYWHGGSWVCPEIDGQGHVYGCPGDCVQPEEEP